jgi:competence protein ComEC
MSVRDETRRHAAPGRPAADGTGFAARAAGTLESALDRQEGRLLVWWPVVLAIGIGVYFSLPFEPDWRLALGLAAASVAIAAAARRRAGSGYAVGLALFALATGFAAAALRTHLVAAPVIAERLGPVDVAGTVSEVEARGAGRVALTIAPRAIGRLAPDALPAAGRVTMARSLAGTVLAGDRIALRAVLLPPPGPTAPGAFDYARDAWFERLGAVGFAVSPALGDGAAADLGFALAVERLRERITGRILAAVPTPQGAIAAALLAGKRGAIPDDVLAALRDAGLAHLLAISGLHMALVCGAVYAAVSFVLSLVPWLALRITTGKWAAAAALLAGLGYYLIAGGSVATERAFIMAAISLGAVMLDRPAITMRNVAIAATIVLLMRPESLNQAGFQMSFGAVIGLVAFYEKVRAWRRARRETAHPRRRGALATIFLSLAAVAATTVVATLATGPIAAHHFNRVAVYGLLANLVAVPLTGSLVMPLGLVALAAMTVGYEALPLEWMALAIGYIVDVARLVTSWDGAVRLVPSMPSLFLVLFAAGGIWLSLWRGRGRLVAAAPLTLAAIIAATARQPDLLIAREAGNIALRNDAGTLSVARPRAESFSVEQWLRRDGDTRAPAEAAPGAFACDFAGCAATAANGLAVAYVTRRDALGEECWASDILITPLVVTTPCPAGLVIDLMAVRRRGTHAVRLTPDGGIAEVIDAHSVRGDRPWSRTGG